MHYVIALEEGRFDELPSSVQYKGMLNNYAGFLDLDTEAILLKYAEALQLKRQEALLLVESKQKKRSIKIPNPGGMPKQGLPTARSLFSLDIFVVIILVVITFASLIWGASAIVSYQVDPRATKTAQSQIDALIHTATAEAGLTPTTTLEPPNTETVAAVTTGRSTYPDIRCPGCFWISGKCIFRGESKRLHAGHCGWKGNI